MPDRPRVVLATGNRGKLREFAAMAAQMGLQLVPQSDFGIEPPEETGRTFLDNALIKARHAAELSGLPAMADDSGLEVDALEGAPGVYSARYAGVGASDAANLARLLQALAAVPTAARRARFRCVIAFVRTADDLEPIVGTGSWEGTILSAPRGEGGFGYDPVFAPLDTLGVTELVGSSVAEWPAELKNRHSHRSRALHALLSNWR